MARVLVPLNQITRPGLADPTPVTGDATNNHYVQNDGRMFLRVKNSNSGSTARTVTINIDKTVDGVDVPEVAHSIAAGAQLWLGPFPTDVYNDTVNVDVSHAELLLTAFHL